MAMIQYLMYASLAVLIIGTIARAIKVSRMPIHLRWDLYPIPHEKGKEHYGGSYYEELNWWTKPANFSLYGEVKEMAAEIFAIKTLYRHNRKMWLFSLPFHLGLYSLVGFIILLIVGAVMLLSGISLGGSSDGSTAMVVYYLTILSGVAGFSLGIFGAVGLLLTRISSEKYRKFSVKSDYFNLLLLLGLFIVGFVTWLKADTSFEALRTFMAGFLLFSSPGYLPVLVKWELILTAVFFAYLPFTHMTHFVGKFFTYHRVRWQDEPNFAGSEIEEKVIEELHEPVSWSAPHMHRGKSWFDGATTPESDEKEGK